MAVLKSEVDGSAAEEADSAGQGQKVVTFHVAEHGAALEAAAVDEAGEIEQISINAYQGADFEQVGEEIQGSATIYR